MAYIVKFYLLLFVTTLLSFDMMVVFKGLANVGQSLKVKKRSWVLFFVICFRQELTCNPQYYTWERKNQNLTDFVCSALLVCYRF
jgi:hypothetical protein